MREENNKAIYLPGLNGIRAIAAISVIISHIGIHLDYFGFKNIRAYSLADYGVTMFFALSGFLITYLILIEKRLYQKINIRQFYIRRVLRIWPLYFFYMFITLVILLLLKFNVDKNLIYYIFMIPNYPFAITTATGLASTVMFLGHYWSVGVEEQFYAFWPWIMNKTKNLLLISISLFIGFIFVKALLSIFHANVIVITFFHYTRFGCLALGGIFAFLYVNDSKLIQILKMKIFEIIAWSVFVLVAFNLYGLYNIIEHEVFAFFTLIIIVNQISNPKRVISLENRVFDYLGKISYGLYIYNPLMIYLVSLVMKNIIKVESEMNLVIIYMVTTISIIFVAHLSYFYFEKPFLRLKSRFTTIESRSSKI